MHWFQRASKSASQASHLREALGRRSIQGASWTSHLPCRTDNPSRHKRLGFSALWGRLEDLATQGSARRLANRAHMHLALRQRHADIGLGKGIADTHR
jgi:hypothetical protein